MILRKILIVVVIVLYVVNIKQKETEEAKSRINNQYNFNIIFRKEKLFNIPTGKGTKKF